MSRCARASFRSTAEIPCGSIGTRIDFPYLTDVRWDKKGGLTLCVQTRYQDELQLLHAGTLTGKTTKLVTVHDPAWVAIQHDTPRWLDDGSFLWSGEGLGGEQLELRDKNGELRRVVVGAEAGYMGLVDVDTKNGQIVYQASTNPTRGTTLPAGSQRWQTSALTEGAGQFEAVFSKNHAIYALQANTLHSMPKTTVHRVDGTLIGELPSVAEDPPIKPNTKCSRSAPILVSMSQSFRPRNFGTEKAVSGHRLRLRRAGASASAGDD